MQTLKKPTHSTPDAVPTAGNDIFAILERRTTAMKISEVARLLCVGENTLYVHARDGRFPAYEAVGGLRVNPSELVRYLKARSTAANREVAA